MLPPKCRAQRPLASGQQKGGICRKPGGCPHALHLLPRAVSEETPGSEAGGRWSVPGLCVTAVPTCAGEQASAGQGDTLNLALAPSGEELTRALPRHPGEGLGAQGTAGVRRGRVWGLLTRTTSRGPPTPPPAPGPLQACSAESGGEAAGSPHHSRISALSQASRVPQHR